MDSSELNSVQVGEVDIGYILMYNYMKTSADMLAPEVSEIIITFMKKYSKWVFVKNVLARLLCFDTKLSKPSEAKPNQAAKPSQTRLVD